MDEFEDEGVAAEEGAEVGRFSLFLKVRGVFHHEVAPSLGDVRERGLAGSHLHHRDAEGPNISLHVKPLLQHRVRLDHLGGHVRRRPFVCCHANNIVRLEVRRRAKVAEFASPFSVEQHILRLDVAVDPPQLVDVVEAAEDVANKGAQRLEGDALAGGRLDLVRDGAPRRELHKNLEVAVVDLLAVNVVDDVLML